MTSPDFPQQARRAPWLLIVVALVVVAIGAASITYAVTHRDSATPAAASSPTPAGPPVDGGTYDSPLLLVDAMAKHGIDCTGYAAIAAPTGAISRGNCHVAGVEYTVGIYASAADARAQPAMEAELLKGVSDVDMVMGRNWTVGCPDASAAAAVAAALGGETFHDPA